MMFNKGDKSMNQTTQMSEEEIANATKSLAKLPILGPAMWLCARDPQRKFMFINDIEWLMMPPLVLDQCHLFTKQDIPFGFITWAFVDDTVDARLRSGHPKIAPHEWNQGNNVWLIDVITPFGHMEELVQELLKVKFGDKKVSTLIPDPNGGAPRIKEWPAISKPGEKDS